MKFKILLSLLALSCVLPSHAKLNVITTTADLGALAKEVGGDEVKITVLARTTEDPHFVDPKPSFLVQLSRADLLIEGGAELEIGWLPPLIDGARNPKLAAGAPGHLAANQGVQLLEVPATLSRAQGDIHAMGNPHFIVDPENALKVSENIAAKFCALDPKGCDKFKRNQKAFADRLQAKLREWDQRLAPFKGQHVASYHNSWPYFGKRFDLIFDIFLEPKPGIPPSPAHLAEVIDQMKKDKVKAIFCEPYLNHKTAEKVGEETGAVVIEVSQFPGALKGVKDDYISLLDHVVNSLAEALKK
jgi:zinc/manganese transport system substrate-binding protein